MSFAGPHGLSEIVFYDRHKYARPFTFQILIGSHIDILLIHDSAQHHQELVADAYLPKHQSDKERADAVQFLLDLCNARYP